MTGNENSLKPPAVYAITFLLLLTVLLLTQIFQLLYAQAKIFPSGDMGSLSSFHILLGTATQAVLAVSLALLVSKKVGLQVFEIQNKFNLLQMLLGLLGLIAIYVVINIFVGLFDIKIDPYENLPRKNLQAGKFNFLLAVVLIAPLYEEFLYRGVILGSIINSYTDPTPLQTILALSYSSLLFAGMHFSLDNFIPIFLIGLYLGALSLYKKNIFLPMLVHLLNNLYISIQFLWGN